MIEKLEQLDKELFLFLNGHHNAFWDGVMDVLSGRLVWIPLYLLLLFLVLKVFRQRAWLIIAAVALLILLSDRFSVLIKNTTLRYRPCHNLELQDAVHVVNGCGGQYGFVSSHAANTFALAMLLTLLFRRQWRYFSFVIFPWAVLVSYSRIYNGVHYPADIVGGALLGIVLAIAVHRLWLIADRKISLRAN